MPVPASHMFGSARHRARLAAGGLGRPTAPDGARTRGLPAGGRKPREYASRRSGADPENMRRRSSSSFVPPSVTHAPPRGALRLSMESRQTPARPHQSAARPQEPRRVSAGYAAAPIDPRVARRRSIDYAARRSGATRENQRSGALSTFSSSASAPTPAATARAGSPPIDPRVARRKSVDYAARRSGASRESRRSGSMAPLTAARRSGGAPPIDPRVARRKSIDYAARRSGSTRENQRSRSGSMAPLTAARRSGNAPPIDPRVARRKSVDYSARRSGSTREDRAAAAPQGAAAPRGGAPPIDPRVARRRTVDYAARRSGNSRQSRGDGAGAGRAAGAGGAASSGLDGVSLRPPPVVRRKVPSYEARRSRNYDTAHTRRLRQQYTVGEVQAVLAARNNLPPRVTDALNKAARRLSGDASPPQPTAMSPRVSPDEENLRRGLGPAMPGFAANGAAAREHVDLTEPALKSVDGLMSAICRLGNVSMQQLKADAGELRPPAHRHRHFDAAESALANVSGLAEAIAKLSK